MTELFFDEEKADLSSDTVIAQTIQVNDLGDIRYREINYTNHFKLPKTPNNMRIFNWAGVPGNVSLQPYRRLSAKLLVDGLEIISDGWAHITAIEKYNYEVIIYSGGGHLFDVIKNKKINDLDFLLLDHQTHDVDGYLASWSKRYGYIYALGNFRQGYEHMANVPYSVYQPTKFGVDIRYQMPSMFVYTIWEKIFHEAGFKYEGDAFKLSRFRDEVIPICQNKYQQEIPDNPVPHYEDKVVLCGTLDRDKTRLDVKDRISYLYPRWTKKTSDKCPEGMGVSFVGEGEYIQVDYDGYLEVKVDFKSPTIGGRYASIGFIGNLWFELISSDYRDVGRKYAHDERATLQSFVIDKFRVKKGEKFYCILKFSYDSASNQVKKGLGVEPDWGDPTGWDDPKDPPYQPDPKRGTSEPGDIIPGMSPYPEPSWDTDPDHYPDIKPKPSPPTSPGKRFVKPFIIEGQILMKRFEKQSGSNPMEDSTIDFTFENMLPDIKQSDFVQDIMRRYGLVFKETIEGGEKKCEFISIDEILKGARGVVDWSDKFVSVEKEEYRIGKDYGRNNFMRHDYIDGYIDSLWNKNFIKENRLTHEFDGNIQIKEDKIIKETNELFKSPYKIQGLRVVYGEDIGFIQGEKGGVKNPRFFRSDDDAIPIWDIPVLDKEGKKFQKADPQIFRLEYKTVMLMIGNKHEHFRKVNKRVPFLSRAYMGYQEFIDKFYHEFERVLGRQKKIIALFNLTAMDICMLDFFKIYYIWPLGRHYYLNKIIAFKEHALTKCELIEIWPA